MVNTAAIKAVNRARNESLNAVYTTVNLNVNAPGQAIYFSNEHLRGWPGNKTNLLADGSNLIVASSLTWQTLPDTWAAWAHWSQTPAGDAEYHTPAIDLTKEKSAKVLLSAGLSGETAHVWEQRTFDFTSEAWRSWAAVPVDQTVAGKRFQFRLKISTNGISPAVLSSLQIIMTEA